LGERVTVGSPGRLPEHWPLTVLLLGLPVWWLLGVVWLVPLVLAVPMALQLHRQRRIRVPPGIGWWLLFLVWATLGAMVLWSDAPGAVPGGGGGSRLVVFGYRLCWYVACAVVVLWVANADRRWLPDRLVHRLVGAVFVIAVAGGFLGLVAPMLEFRSALEWVLPPGIRANAFVQSLAHAEAADVQTVLGRPEARPKAPFAFTNTWGSAISLSALFFLASLRHVSVRTRLAAAGLLAAAAVPILYSLNRGLWGSLALGVVGVVVLAVAKGHRRMVLAVVATTVVAGTLLLASPLGGIYQDRLDHQHSNERRGQLVDTTVSSVSKGSPIVGFGSTRDVQGSFASISGASTPDCSACGVPPLGTQGQLWLILFSQGWPGLAFFLIFVLLALSRSWRCRTTNETVCTFAIAFLLFQLPIYDTLGLPLYLVMIAIGLAARDHAEGRGGTTPSWVRLTHPRQRREALLVTGALAVVGGVVALAVVPDRGEARWTTQVAIALAPAPVYLDTGLRMTGAGEKPPREITIDTEAAILLSERSLRRAVAHVGGDTEVIRSSLSVSAVPNSYVLEMSVSGTQPDRVRSVATAVAVSYLSARQDYLDQRRDDELVGLRAQLRDLSDEPQPTGVARALLTAAVDHLEFSRPSVGQLIRIEPPRSRSRVAVPGASGAAVGILLAVAWLSARDRRPPPRKALP
jgi:hypothetical protein